MVDAELVEALKQARGRTMYFAFIPKGTGGKLIASMREITPREIGEAKKEMGGGIAVVGTFFGPFSDMVFQVAKAPPPTLAIMLKNVVKLDTGLDIVANVQLAPNQDESAEE